MIILDATTKSLEMILAGAVTTTEWDFVTHYVDFTASAFTAGSNDGVSTGAAAKTIVAAPGASTSRQLKGISILNRDTVIGTVTIQYNNNGTKRKIINVPLSPGEEIIFCDGDNWRIYDANGSLKTVGATGKAAGLRFLFNTSTTIASTGVGEIRLDNATLSSVANLGIRLNVDADGNDNTTFIEAWDDSTTTGHRGYVHIYKESDPTKFVILDITGAITIGTSGGTDIVGQFPVTPVAWSATNFSAADSLRAVFIRTGDKGSTGSTGSQGQYGGAVVLDYLWDTGTSDADPGSGKIRGDNATTASIAKLFIDLTDNNSQSQTSLIDTFDASTSTTKCRIRLFKKADVTKWMVFTMTARTTATGYRKLSVAQVSQSGASPFANGDEILIDVDFTGDLGATGATGASGGTREQTDANPSSITTTVDTKDIHTVTGMTQACTINAPTGTPVQGQKLLYRFKDNGTGRALTWNAIFIDTTVVRPTTTVASATLYVGFVYNSTDTKWECVGKA